jgi:hypothetical protein
MLTMIMMVMTCSLMIFTDEYRFPIIIDDIIFHYFDVVDGSIL